MNRGTGRFVSIDGDGAHRNVVTVTNATVVYTFGNAAAIDAGCSPDITQNRAIGRFFRMCLIAASIPVVDHCIRHNAVGSSDAVNVSRNRFSQPID